MADENTITAVETETAVETKTPDTAEADANSTEIARLKAELAKAKAATDKATKEAGDYKKALRAKQTAEEAKAEEDAERHAAMEKELNELRKEKAVATTSRKVFAFVQDEQTANSVAEFLYGAEDVEAALDAIQKAWNAREKALRVEYGRIPAPGAGGNDGSSITREQLDKMTYMERNEYATKHPDEYNKLMGRG